MFHLNPCAESDFDCLQPGRGTSIKTNRSTGYPYIINRGVMDYLVVRVDPGDLTLSGLMFTFRYFKRLGFAGATLTFMRVIRKADLCYGGLNSCAICDL